MMMRSPSIDLHSWWRIIALLLLLVNKTFGLNTDGILLLSFKYSVLSDPLGVLRSWSYTDETPCSWNGVTCGKSDAYLRVTGLTLPNSQLLGPISPDLSMIEHLRNLDLSNNSMNGSIPLTLYNATHLRVLDLSNNLVSGELLDLVGGLKSLEFLNLSDNALAGEIPRNITRLRNLTVVSMKNNYFSGNLPSGFDKVEVFDLSSNLINGSLPPGFGGGNLNYLNVSFNRLSGKIPLEFTNEIPANATVDLSFNNFTGQIPESSVLFNQNTTSFAGNPELCGKPLKNLCFIPSTISTNVSEPTSPPAIAAIPKTFNSGNSKGKNGLKATTIVGIIVGDIAGLGILVFIFMCIYQRKKRKSLKEGKGSNEAKEFDWASSSSEERSWMRAWACLLNRGNNDEDHSTETSSSDSEDEKIVEDMKQTQVEQKTSGSLVTVDGERELELETLLKASAYILGATGSSIMYKAVLEDGTTLAVRRIGESSVERFRDFENQVRLIAKLVHPNLVRIRGFYWGTDEKLVIYDFVPNGSLANARYRKVGSSPCPLPWELRLKIAKGIARGLTYIHEKKHVHGNLKPSNILLGPDMEPKIGDFGLERLLTGETSSKAGGSARNFGSKRSTASRDSFQDAATGATPSPSPSSIGCVSPYYAPESLRSLKPNLKWDVFSFGVVLLELLTGKVIVSDELCPVAAILAADEKGRVLRIADVTIRADMEGKEDAFLSLVKLGYSCISPVPQKRPPMKEALQVLEKFPSTSSLYFGP